MSDPDIPPVATPLVLMQSQRVSLFEEAMEAVLYFKMHNIAQVCENSVVTGKIRREEENEETSETELSLCASWNDNVSPGEPSCRAVATGGISGYNIPPPKSVYLKFFMWLFCLLAMTS